jgi:integrase
MGRPRSAARKAFPSNLQQNKAGYFSWRDPRSGKSHGIGRDRQQAFTEARAANAMLAQEESKTLVEKIKVSDCPSLATWIDTWIEDISPGLAHKTVKNHKSALSKLRATCGHLPLADIKPKMVADILEAYSDAGQGRMAELARATALDLFRAAEVRGHIEVGKNPVTATKAKGSKVKRLRLSLEDFLKVHAATHRPWLRSAMELALVTAQRRGDVAAMKRSDIVDGHMQVDQRKSGGKTKLGIPLTLRLDVVGWSLKEVIDRCRTAGLIAPHLIHHRTPGGHYRAGDPVTLNTISTKFAEAVLAAGLETEEGRTLPTFHEIRSLAIRLYTAQNGKEFAQALAGHKDMKTTLLYTDPRDSEAVRIMIPDPKISTNFERVSNDPE